MVPGRAWPRHYRSFRERQCQRRSELRRGGAATNSVSDNLIAQLGFAPPQALEVFFEDIQHIVLIAPCLARAVRRDEDIGQVPQRRLSRQWLLRRNIDGGAGNAPGSPPGELGPPRC